MLKEVSWSEDRDYKSGSSDEPLQFYLDALCNSKSFDLLLGYFSSAAINILSLGFAKFIYSGGKMRAVINNILSEEDKKAVEKGQNKNYISTLYNFNNITELKNSLDEYGRHFFECFAWLIANGRIEIKIIKPKNKRGISHYKSGVFSDGFNTISYKSSCNFTYYGFLENLEELECTLSWEDDKSNRKIKKYRRDFEEVFNGNSENVDYLNITEVETAIKNEFGDKTINELLIQEKELLDKKVHSLKNTKIQASLIKAINLIEEIEKEPKFPYTKGPRDYQIEAYQNWVNNEYKGLFAMATGTGKTLTSLNFILQEYKKNNYYKFIVLVPTTALAKQWVEEANLKFNYQNIILCCSENSYWKDELSQAGKSVLFGRQINYGIITTYASFKGVRFQTILKEFFQNDFDNMTLIADEAHNFGSSGFLKVIPNFISKRIGLSATPERQFDEEGNRLLNEYFSCADEQYTFEYNMKTAIENEILCRYFYYPVIVNLEIDEQERYLKISKELLKYIDPETGKYRDSDYVNNLLIKRKNIIHKAKNKLNALLSIINKIGKENFKKAFIYVPEGIEFNVSENESIPEEIENDTSKLIDNYLIEIFEQFQLKMAKFTGETKNRDQILNQFKEGKLDALLAMKCLDEGVDVPQTQYAIFCSSTGNPRQYIQRRGRVLRMHKEKKYAIIYDLIVKPAVEHTNVDESLSKMEKNIFLSELRRLVNFAVLSENKDESLRELEALCYDLDIDIYKLANNELNNYKQNEIFK